MRRLLVRLLAGLLGLQLALGIGRSALALESELARTRALQQSLDRTRGEIARLEQPLTDREVRRWAFRQMGLAAPGDVVFFDGGAGSWHQP